VLVFEGRGTPVTTCLVVGVRLPTVAAPTHNRHWKPCSPICQNAVFVRMPSVAGAAASRKWVERRPAVMRKPRSMRKVPQTKRGPPGLLEPWRTAFSNAIGRRANLAEAAGAPRDAAAAAAAGTS